MRRSVAFVFTFRFAAKSYVQKSCVLPTSSAGGVVRTGSNPLAGTPSRPRTARVSANPSAYGIDLARSAAVMSSGGRAGDERGGGGVGAEPETRPGRRP